LTATWALSSLVRKMTLDPELVRAGRRLRERLAELGAEVDRVQADLRGQVGLLRAAGGSSAEIAAAIGLDERQVRELLPAAPVGPPPAVEAPPAPVVSGENRAAEPAAAKGYGAEAEGLDGAEEAELGGPSRQAAAVGWATLACSFCGASQETVGRLIAGPGVAICDGCARRALDLLVEGDGEGGGLRLVGGDPRDRSRCSFCGKRSRRVGRLVAGSSGIHICGECLDLCTEILREGNGR
jgi:ClpX C4-type zinc finger